VGPRAGMDEVKKRKFLTLRGLEVRPLGRPARSQALYRLNYPGSQDLTYLNKGINVCIVEICVRHVCNFGYAFIHISVKVK
jgi:hypothetical protein